MTAMVRKIKKILKNPRILVLMLAEHGLFNWMPDKMYLKLVYRYRIGKKLNIENPETYNEKLQWLKLYDRRQEYTVMADKLLARDYIAQKIGEEFLVPLITVWDCPKEVNFSELPKQFVLKCNHDSGSVVVCSDKTKLDTDKAIKKLTKGFKKNGYWYGREWPYRNIRPRIFAEKYLEGEDGGGLRDYKFYTFNGKVKAVMVNSDRGTATKADYFDREYNKIDLIFGYPNSEIPPERPKNFEKMIELAEELSAGIPQLRVDFYESSGKVYVGELTFFDGSGFESFEPDSWDKKFGEWITLPKTADNTH